MCQKGELVHKLDFLIYMFDWCRKYKKKYGSRELQYHRELYLEIYELKSIYICNRNESQWAQANRSKSSMNNFSFL